ncbi:uncharacterized protein LOC117138185 [Drosophila mauritiana]|uniref:Uncharacterized protein LOC117138185 n=1 Tax=Drosophila mauritiana TaxID=7226 RepID=A0A6P8JJH5_DROMA|nr:uncharacterized protein LOC117138185 [Drosophila mauritiana]
MPQETVRQTNNHKYLRNVKNGPASAGRHEHTYVVMPAGKAKSRNSHSGYPKQSTYLNIPYSHIKNIYFKSLLKYICFLICDIKWLCLYK